MTKTPSITEHCLVWAIEQIMFLNTRPESLEKSELSIYFLSK